MVINRIRIYSVIKLRAEINGEMFNVRGRGKSKLTTASIYIRGTILLSGKNVKALITFAISYIPRV